MRTLAWKGLNNLTFSKYFGCIKNAASHISQKILFQNSFSQMLFRILVQKISENCLYNTSGRVYFY